MAKSKPAHKMAPPFPSAPTRPPAYSFKFMRDPNKHVQTVGFGAEYSALAFIEAIVGENEIRWRDDGAFHIPDIGITVIGDGLEDVMEYSPTEEESAWELPSPYIEDAAAIATGEKRKIASTGGKNKLTEEDTGDPTTKEKRTPRAPKASKDGLTSIARICADISMDPRDARSILRKSSTPKPDAGWAWSPAEAKKIAALLTAGAKDNGGDKTPAPKEKTNEETSERSGKASGKKAPPDKAAAAGKRKSKR